MEDVAEDGDLEAVDDSFALADGERVEERLRRVFVRAVAGVDDAGVADAGELLRCAR
jgi:hypothetical protein